MPFKLNNAISYFFELQKLDRFGRRRHIRTPECFVRLCSFSVGKVCLDVTTVIMFVDDSEADSGQVTQLI